MNFRNPNSLNVFVSLDLRHYQSGKLELSDQISKHGNPIGCKISYHAIRRIDATRHFEPCHVANY
jgi:transposase